jgi:exopolyphosphatase/guanosine-5'-triphosphate,3'-diphosphate pyrophosphatase
MVEEVSANLRAFAAANGIDRRVAAGAVQMLGTSGTVTTLAGVYLDLPRYNRAVVDGCYLEFAAIREISRRLAAMTCAERTANPCIGAERADLVVAGCAILEAICGLWPVGRLRVADRGVREGILAGLILANRRDHRRRRRWQ